MRPGSVDVSAVEGFVGGVLVRCGRLRRRERERERESARWCGRADGSVEDFDFRRVGRGMRTPVRFLGVASWDRGGGEGDGVAGGWDLGVGMVDQSAVCREVTRSWRHEHGISQQ